MPADPEPVASERGACDSESLRVADELLALAASSADPEPLDPQSCFYTTTGDERFLLERHGRIVVGSACSGHAFKFGPAVGNRLAALALEALA